MPTAGTMAGPFCSPFINASAKVTSAALCGVTVFCCAGADFDEADFCFFVLTKEWYF
jgi:hypothetical protein